MKFITILLLAFIYSSSCFSQSKSDIVGNWVSLKATVSEDYQLEGKVLQMTKAMALKVGKTQFEFLPNNRVNITSELKDISTQNGYWQFNEEKKLISIKDQKYKSRWMEIIVIPTTDGNYFFYVEETPFILTVKRK